ncbi:MAG TPA: DUF4442 domain-containing protein [Flavobacteriales bacterium]
MSQELLNTYIENHKKESRAFMKLVNNRFLFRCFLLSKLPMAFLAGIRLKSINEQRCEVTVCYKWLNQNPFRSTYFAVLAMAGEMSSGIIALYYTRNAKPSIAMLVSNLEAEFLKKASGRTTFKFEDGHLIKEAIRQTVLTGEPRTVRCKATGYSEKGEKEAVFYVTWSFKRRG